LNNELELSVKRPLRAVPESDWGWKNEAVAIASMIARSGLQEKTVAIECGIDASTLAKVKQGTARPSEEHLNSMMDATGSEAWLIFWLIKRGYDPKSLRKLESETEKRAREAEEALAQERLKVRVLTEALHGRVAA
jgi:transcriptional regulator with XRE-family HTH domain